MNEGVDELQRRFGAEGLEIAGANGVEPDGEAVRLVDPSPYLRLRLDPSLRNRASLLRLTLTMESWAGAPPWLAIEADGEPTGQATTLKPEGHGRFTALIPLPALVDMVRLYLGDGPGEVRLRALSAEPCGPDEAAEWLEAPSPDSLAMFAAQSAMAFEEMRGAARRARRAAEHRERTVAFDRRSPEEVEAMRRAALALPDPPTISVVMPVYRTDPALLRAAIDSVRAQLYPYWQLCIADDFSQDAALTALLDAAAADDPRIRVVHRDRNGHISEASNSALELATGGWIALLDHDDLLTPDALLRVAQEAAAHPDAAVIYSDEDKVAADDIDGTGPKRDGYHKPDFSLELFRSQNYLNHLTAIRADEVRAVSGWRVGYEGSQDHDLLLRVIERMGGGRVRHIPAVLYHWRTSAGSTAVSGDEKGYAFAAGTRALEDHLKRLGLRGHVEKAPRVPYYRVRLDAPEPPPKIALIIPTRDKADILQLCIESILRRTDYPDYEIVIVDNGSVEQRTAWLFDKLRADPRVRIVPYDAPFNFSAINNFGVRQTDAPLVALVNNDIEVISPDWLTEMASWTVQPDVGCVGAKLYYPGGTIQHAGVILGIGGVAGHSHKHFQRDALGHFGRLMVAQDLSAVTAACLLVRRSIYWEVGGLNEAHLSVAFNDVDFCLRVLRAGYRNVFTPFAELYHHESASRGAEDDPLKIARFNREIAYMKRTWGEALDEDPFYSPHLTLVHENFESR